MRNPIERSGAVIVTWMMAMCGVVNAQLDPIWSSDGGLNGSWFGRSLSRAGDVNGDGFEDMIVGAPHGRKVLYWEGLVFVFYGGPSGLDTAEYWVDAGTQAQAQLGYSVTGGGDLNGDGYDDVAAGALYYADGQPNEGAVFVYYGSSVGLAPVPQLILQADQAQAMFGHSVVVPGDVNGDGFDDLLVGAPYYDDGPVNEGTVFLYYGSASGVDSVADWSFETGQESSYADVHRAGDVNGDGFADIAVSSLIYDAGQTDEGRAFVFHGSPTGPGSSPTWAFSPDDDYSYLSCAEAVGDVNGDGYGDLVVGAHGFGWISDDNLTGHGGAFLFLGGPSGLSDAPAWMMEAGSGGSSFGNAVAGVGDADGDGLDDVVVCDRARWAADPQEGSASLYVGTPSGLALTPLWDVTSGQGGAFYGHALCGGMDANGNGVPEWLVGAPSYNNIDAAEGAVFLHEWSGDPMHSSSLDALATDGLITRYENGLPLLELAGAGHAALLQVTDAQGRVLSRRSWNGSTLPLVGLTPGAYLVSVSEGAFNYHRSVIVGR